MGEKNKAIDESEKLLSKNPDYVLLLIGLLMLAWGIYILILAVWGVRA